MPKTVNPEDNIFAAFGCEDPDMLEVKAVLMLELRRYIKSRKMTQRQAAEFFGTHQPRINDMAQGDMSKFTIDYLIKMVNKAGKRVRVIIDDQPTPPAAGGQNQEA